jgi:DNA polymerase III epsilon subunit-like protein
VSATATWINAKVTVRAGRLKLARPLVAFDLETTGLDTKRDRIVEFAAVRWCHGAIQTANTRHDAQLQDLMYLYMLSKWTI